MIVKLLHETYRTTLSPPSPFPPVSRTSHTNFQSPLFVTEWSGKCIVSWCHIIIPDVNLPAALNSSSLEVLQATKPAETYTNYLAPLIYNLTFKNPASYI
jgi:hypothetical protein